MREAIIYAPGDVRLEDRPAPEIVNPTDAVIRIATTCVCGSDLWDYRGINPVTEPTPTGHEYAGVVEEVGAEVRSVKPGQFVIGSFFASDGTCPTAWPDTSPRASSGSSSAVAMPKRSASRWPTAPWSPSPPSPPRRLSLACWPCRT
jgi:NADPH:quinone reductase-like Zn-dependent oxidoreductase